MTQQLTDQDCAKLLMAIFRKLDVKAGGGIPGSKIATNWAVDTLRSSEDLERGWAYAIKEGWVEEADVHQGLKLTPKGSAKL